MKERGNRGPRRRENWVEKKMELRRCESFRLTCEERACECDLEMEIESKGEVLYAVYRSIAYSLESRYRLQYPHRIAGNSSILGHSIAVLYLTLTVFFTCFVSLLIE